MSKGLKSIIVFSLLCSMLFSTVGLAYAKGSPKDSKERLPEGLRIVEEKPIGPLDVGWNPRKTIYASKYYTVTQSDVDNLKAGISGVFTAVSTYIGALLEGPLGAAVAAFCGDFAGTRLGDAVANGYRIGNYWTESSQNYEFVGGNTWIWRWGNSYHKHIDTGYNWSYQQPVPPNIYAYGL